MFYESTDKKITMNYGHSMYSTEKEIKKKTILRPLTIHYLGEENKNIE